ncbi:MAG: hypothetical protein RIQ41_193 [Candidatus Parcubacteria bacterium]|jgi:ADP-heptose:LPS heptosyltransferase
MKAREMPHNPGKYSQFVFLSAGPVGDHALIIDWASRFYESTSIPSTILLKHPNPFLLELAAPYKDQISQIGFSSVVGKFRTLSFVLTSIWRRRCYVLVLPIPPPLYLKVFAYYIRFFTRSRIVALDSLCGFSIPGGPVSSASFVGKANYIPACVDTELYYEEANRMLTFLGYHPVSRVPFLAHHEHPEVLQECGIDASPYIVFHIRASGPDRSLPVERWQHLCKRACELFPETKLVFTGATSDRAFIEQVTHSLPEERIRYIIAVSAQKLLTVYAHACANVTVHTGNAHLINMIHARAVTVNFKGVHMFRFSYNQNGVELFSSIGCTCHPLERKCSMVEYKGQGYMACLFNTKDEDIIRALQDVYTTYEKTI